MSNLAVIGAQWGDEGKGKIVDLLAAEVELVVRFAGGANAGHTLVVDGTKHVLHLLPSGVLRPNTICVLGAGLVVDPTRLIEEIDALAAAGVVLTPERLKLARRAHLVLAHHVALDRLRERGPRAIGSTLRGIGPAYEDKAARRGVRVADLADPERLRAKVELAVADANTRLLAGGAETIDAGEVLAGLDSAARRLLPYAADVDRLLHEEMAAGKRVLFEGAQGVLLDIDHGSYPFVTSSSTGAGGVCTGAGVGPRDVGRVVGVAKAYLTRVGEGPFPSELQGEAAERLRQAGGEYGATTGRPRRCGWLDLVALRHAVRVGGLDALAITKVDVLAGMPEVSACVAYELDGVRTDHFPVDAEECARLQPVLERMQGWKELDPRELSLEAARGGQLPACVAELVSLVEQATGVPVVLLSVGPQREQTLGLSTIA